MTTDADSERLHKRIAALAKNKIAAPSTESRTKPSSGEKERARERTPTFRAGRVVYSGKGEVGCIIRDMTDAGARIALDGEAGLPPEVTLVISQTAARRRATVVWQKNREVGLAFESGPGEA